MGQFQSGATLTSLKMATDIPIAIKDFKICFQFNFTASLSWIGSNNRQSIFRYEGVH